jgi:MFS family permease
MSYDNILLKNRDIRLLWISQVLSQAGNRMFQISVAWWILKQTTESSGLALATFMILGALPSIVFVRWIGKIVDSQSARKILLTSDLLGVATALALVACLLSGITSHVVIFISGLLFAIFSAFIDPTLGKCVGDLVDKEDLESAVALNSSTSLMASFCGAIFGALLIDVVGIVGIVLINGASYLISAICDLLINFRSAKAGLEVGPGLEMEKIDIFAEIPLVKGLLYGFAAVNFFGTPVLVILPIYTKVVLAGSARTLSFLEGAIWMGLLCGTFSAKFFGLKSRPIFFTGLCLSAFAFFLSLPGIRLSQFMYGISLFGVGISLGLLNVRLITLFQQIVPADVKGRFFSLLQAMTSFTVPIGFFIFGWMTDVVSIYLVSGVQGAGLLMTAVFYLGMSGRESEVIGYMVKEGEAG